MNLDQLVISLYESWALKQIKGIRFCDEVQGPHGISIARPGTWALAFEFAVTANSKHFDGRIMISYRNWIPYIAPSWSSLQVQGTRNSLRIPLFLCNFISLYAMEYRGCFYHRTLRRVTKKKPHSSKMSLKFRD